MKLRSGIIIAVFFLAACTTQQINQTMGVLNDAMSDDELTSADVANGLKQALEQGISEGADLASATDGYFKNQAIKILFPPEAQKVEQKLRQLGMNSLVDKFMLTMNRAAEKAADEAKPIFVSAIRQMTIQDAWGILRGSEHAATEYLKAKTTDQLRSRYQPIISNALETVDATKYYDDIVTTYNRIPMVEKVNPDLDAYVTDRAIDGLFLLIAKEEEKIRKDPVARTTELMKKVFAQQ